MNRNLAVLVLLLGIVLISGCISEQPSKFVTPENVTNVSVVKQNATVNETPAINQRRCGDSYCDEVEIATGGCQQDCVGYNITQQGTNQTFPPPQQNLSQQQGQISVKAITTSYRTVSSKPAGWFKTGQDADIMLSGIDFNDTGGALLFNHPGSIATDGTFVFLADKNNNRVLVWTKPPDGNTPPDIVLGQQNFSSNSPGNALDQMNWPVSVSAADGKVVVTDTYNDRILIWTKPITKNGQKADIVLETGRPSSPNNQPQNPIRWPWGAWTDGKKLAISSTQASSVYIWNTFPTSSNQQPDLVINAQGKMGTPRGITSNGEYLIVADHNSKLGGDFGSSATFVWKTWPASKDQPYDFTMAGWRTGTFLPDNNLILISTTHYPLSIWNSPPADANDQADIQFEQSGTRTGAYTFGTGDGSGIAYADGKLYVSLANENRVIVYRGVPSSSAELPDFAIGAPDIYTNTLETNFIITNAVLASDGKSLFASSDFDRKLYVWKTLPDESNAHPDFVYSLTDAPWDNALWNGTLALAGKRTVYVWKTLPLNGEMPDLVFSGGIGNVNFNDLSGVAIDSKYFYLSDGDNVFVWEGVPSTDSNPKFTISGIGAGRIQSDGEYLVGTVNHSNAIGVWKVAEISASSKPLTVPTDFGGASRRFNLPGSAIAKNGHLFVADTGFGRVLTWRNISDALAGKQADVLLGDDDFEDTVQEIGKNKLFWPATLAFDGSYLWVGEFKFSSRLLRFSVMPLETWQYAGVAIPGTYADAEVVDLGDGEYRMYYSIEPEVPGNKLELFSSTSNDGKVWTKENGVRKEFSTFADVVKLPDGRWRMYFQNAGVIKSAASSDGLAWEDEPGIRIDVGSHENLDSDGVGASTTKILGNGTYLMVYRTSVKGKYDPEAPGEASGFLFWATSEDGLTFKKRGMAVDTRNKKLYGWGDGPELVGWDNGELRLYFWSFRGIYYSVFSNEVFSEPELAFTTNDDPKVVFPLNPPGDPTFIRIGNKWFMYYGQHTKGIYYATLN